MNPRGPAIAGRAPGPGLLHALALAALVVGCRDEDPASGPAGRLQVGAHDPTPVVLIVVDTLRADHLGTWDHRRPTSPGLDAWCESGRVYERALATSPWTLPSFGSIYTGHLPSRHAAGAVVVEGEKALLTGLTPDLPTLAEILRDHGWETGAVVNNPFLAPDFGLDRGFDHYDYVAGDNARTRRADEMVDRALAWIDGRESPQFLLVVHLFDTHMDYDPPEATRGRFTGRFSTRQRLPVQNVDGLRAGASLLSRDDRGFIAAAYDEEIAFVDQQLARLAEELKGRGVLDHGLVLLTSDHGEELFEHGGFEHGHAMWQEVLHVPMVLWGDGVTPGREAEPVSLVDVTPTILAALDLPAPAGLEGRALWPPAEPPPRRTLYAEHVLYGGERKVALQWPHKVELDVAGSRHRHARLDTDPEERAFAVDSEDPQVTALVEQARSHLEALAAQVVQSPAQVSPATLEMLRRLGYEKRD